MTTDYHSADDFQIQKEGFQKYASPSYFILNIFYLMLGCTRVFSTRPISTASLKRIRYTTTWQCTISIKMSAALLEQENSLRDLAIIRNEIGQLVVDYLRYQFTTCFCTFHVINVTLKLQLWKGKEKPLQPKRKKNKQDAKDNDLIHHPPNFFNFSPYFSRKETEI